MGLFKKKCSEAGLLFETDRTVFSVAEQLREENQRDQERSWKEHDQGTQT